MKKWSEADIIFLRENLNLLSYAEIANVLGKTKASVNQFRFQQEKKNIEYQKRNRLHHWSIGEQVPYHEAGVASTAKVIAIDKEKGKIVISQNDEQLYVTMQQLREYSDKCLIKRDEKAQKKITRRTNKTIFKPGNKPWNTGTKGLVKPNKTSFKLGQKLHVLPEFSISFKEYKDGSRTKFIKIGTKWVRLQRYNWEQLFGPIPEGHVIVFKDGDSMNCDPHNLECISKYELGRINQAYQIKRTEQLQRLKAEMSAKAKVRSAKPVKREANVSDEIPVYINAKTKIYVKPGTDIEKVKQRYSNLIN